MNDANYKIEFQNQIFQIIANSHLIYFIQKDLARNSIMPNLSSKSPAVIARYNLSFLHSSCKQFLQLYASERVSGKNFQWGTCLLLLTVLGLVLQQYIVVEDG